MFQAKSEGFSYSLQMASPHNAEFIHCREVWDFSVVFAVVIYDIVLNFGAVKIFTVKTKRKNKRMRIIQRIKVSG